MTKKQEAQIKIEIVSAHKRYKNMLSSHAFFRVGDQFIGEDLVQKTFTKAWIYLSKGGKIDLMKSFLFHILNHLIIDHYRKHKAVSLNILQDKGFEPNNDPSEKLTNTLEGKMAFLLLKQLPEKYQIVIDMHYMQDLSLEEISLVIKQPKETIAVQLCRGIKKLKLLYNSDNIE